MPTGRVCEQHRRNALHGAIRNHPRRHEAHLVIVVLEQGDDLRGRGRQRVLSQRPERALPYVGVGVSERALERGDVRLTSHVAKTPGRRRAHLRIVRNRASP